MVPSGWVPACPMVTLWVMSGSCGWSLVVMYASVLPAMSSVAMRMIFCCVCVSCILVPRLSRR